MSTLNVAALRAETPGCATVRHFNHAGSSLMPEPVLDAVIDHLRLEAEIGGYEAADAAKERVDGVYRSIARLIGAAPTDIALIENATRAWDMAFYSIPFQEGDRILTSVAEYASNVIAFYQVRTRGVSVQIVPNDEHGQIDVRALSDMLDERVRLVAVSHMPTNGGLVQPAAEVGRVLAGARALYLLDACQTVGQLPVDVREIGCHLLSATSRKYLRGPRGAGFLYVDPRVLDELEPPMLDLHAAKWVAAETYELLPDARRFENWERSYATLLGLGAAVDYALTLGMEAIWGRIERVAADLRSRLSAIPGVMVHDLGERKGGIVTFSVDGVAPDEIKTVLAAERINVSTSSVFSTRFDMEARGLEKIVRSSVHYITSDAELDALEAQVRGLAQDAGTRAQPLGMATA